MPLPEPRLIPFKAEHLFAFTNRDGATSLGWKAAASKEEGGPAFTAIAGESMLGCAGVVIPWPGMGIAWVSMGAAALRYPLWVTRTVRRVLQDITRAHRLHRLEACVLAGSAVNRQWIEAIGFTRENGRARSYTADRQDAVRYEWVPVGSGGMPAHEEAG